MTIMIIIIIALIISMMMINKIITTMMMMMLITTMMMTTTATMSETKIPITTPRKAFSKHFSTVLSEGIEPVILCLDPRTRSRKKLFPSDLPKVSDQVKVCLFVGWLLNVPATC